MAADYMASGHRVQTALAFLLIHDPQLGRCQPKHMRVGIDLQKADMLGLATLLIEKGVFTKAEYLEAMAQAAEQEANAYEREVQAIMSDRRVKTV